MPSQKLVGDVVMFIVIKSTTELKLKSMIYIPSRAVPIFYENLVEIFNEYEKLPNKLDSEPTVDHAISTSQSISRSPFSRLRSARFTSKYGNPYILICICFVSFILGYVIAFLRGGLIAHDNRVKQDNA
uniref:Uncharacterized protein n=1 Tax=Acrobeloides nanus TaxID=290746 RepID=A0A914CN21_9BILA